MLAGMKPEITSKLQHAKEMVNSGTTCNVFMFRLFAYCILAIIHLYNIFSIFTVTFQQ